MLPPVCILQVVISLALLIRVQTVNGILCYNYTSTLFAYLPVNAPVVSGCTSCTRGVFSGKWPYLDGQEDIYSWTCSQLAVNIPVATGYSLQNTPECAVGAFEIASHSAGYLAMCTCCNDLCNGALTCKTYPSKFEPHVSAAYGPMPYDPRPLYCSSVNSLVPTSTTALRTRLLSLALLVFLFY